MREAQRRRILGNRMTDGRIRACRQIAVDEANAIMAQLEAEECHENNPNPVTGDPRGWHVGRIRTRPRRAGAQIPYLYSERVLDELQGYVIAAVLFAFRITRIDYLHMCPSRPLAACLTLDQGTQNAGHASCDGRVGTCRTWALATCICGANGVLGSMECLQVTAM